jgi:small subunit ribosomal protein S1
MSPTRDDFAALLDEAMGGRDFVEGSVVKGLVVAIEKDFAIIDVGLKTEGRISLKEFAEADGKQSVVKVGDNVEVYLERVENALGEAVISREKARRAASPSIWAAPRPSCRARRWISAPCATLDR